MFQTIKRSNTDQAILLPSQGWKLLTPRDGKTGQVVQAGMDTE
jgi:hypothetical protein